MVLSLSFSPLDYFSLVAGPEEAKNAAGKCPPPVSDPFSDAECSENLARLSRQFVKTNPRDLESPIRKLLV
jgi:hypothetical protein